MEGVSRVLRGILKYSRVPLADLAVAEAHGLVVPRAQGILLDAPGPDVRGEHAYLDRAN